MNSRNHIPQLSILLLVLVSFIVAIRLSLHPSRPAAEHRSSSLTTQLLGDSRRLFANHFFLKADEYFHKGNYPSIFDQAAMANRSRPAMTVGAVGGDAHADEVEWMQEPRDWIERFSRHFSPSEHAHLDARELDSHDHDGDGLDDHAPHEHDHDHDHGVEHRSGGGDISEILPWLTIAAELNPNRPEVYVTGAYYLRSQLNQVDEAEAFLREGWRNNPRSPAIVYELARIKEEERSQLDIARNLYRVALRYWEESEAGQDEPDLLLQMQILMHFAQAERKAGETDTAIRALEYLKTISPSPEGVQNLIDEYRTPSPLLAPDTAGPEK